MIDSYSTKKRFREFIPEGIAITVSILLAFSIDAWWNDREREAAEREYLQSIIQDY